MVITQGSRCSLISLFLFPDRDHVQRQLISDTSPVVESEWRRIRSGRRRTHFRGRVASFTIGLRILFTCPRVSGFPAVPRQKAYR